MDRVLLDMAPGTARWILYAGCQAWIYRYWSRPGYVATVRGQRCELYQLHRENPLEYLTLMKGLGGQLL